MADDNNNVVVVDENEKDNNDIEVSMETDPDLEKISLHTGLICI